MDEDRSAESDLRCSAPLDVRRRRALFRATHRGTKETDRLIGGWASARIATMDAAALDAFERLMDLPDVDLADWLMGRRPIPPGPDETLLRAIADGARGPARKA